jgi:hypothetical protein
MSNGSTAGTPAPEQLAEVHAHDRVMRYRRRGAGPPVLVLATLAPAQGAAEPLWPELLDALAARHRLLVPELPAGADLGEWLADFLEGLGLGSVTLVAAGPFCGAALELALLAADQVARVLLVADSGANGSGGLQDGSLGGLQAASVPLLVVRRDLPPAEALPLVARFVDGKDDAIPS